ncbi:Hypothetical protein FKW44_005417 [Caligus rogercresseyi]|uniref:Uncharacterized protein n=1 Tax=Caligus rogercresseyi TaxID=217165 RepID=A0A7T8QS09_CALRO|nr:Hypothetical protein FKW44_005417 [Caligus rogercresseyi]
MVRMATELKRVAEEWDPLMSRSLQFSNVIDGGMSVYKDLFARRKKSDNSFLSLCSSPNKHTCTAGFRRRKHCRAQSGCSGPV